MPKSRTFSVLERAEIKLRQRMYRNSISFPFLSGDAFASLADLVIRDETDLKSLSRYPAGKKVVFCRSDLVPRIKQFISSETKHAVLIAGNSDFDFQTKNDLPLENFQHFYLQNSFISDDVKVHTLPIGVENLSIGINGLPKYLSSYSFVGEKVPKVLVGPFSPTNIERNELINFASTDKQTFEIISNYSSPKAYAKLSASFKFIACPRGNGVDTHRFWEALYRGSIPIVKKSEWSRGLENLGLGFIQVEDWSETKLRIEKFEETYSDIAGSNAALWFSWWKEKIQKLKLES